MYMSWFILSLFSLVCFTGYDILSRKLAIDSENPLALSVVYNSIVVLMAPLLLLIEPYYPKQLPVSVIILTALSIVVWGLFGRFEYFAHKHVEASLLAIIIKIAPIITLMLSVLFFNEPITTNKLLGISIIIVSNILIILSTTKNINIQKGLKFALATTLLLGIGWTLDKAVASYYGIALFSMISFGSPIVINAIIPPIKFSSLLTEFKRTSWRLVVLAVFNLLGYASLIKALTIGEASRVTVIATATTPFVILLSAILLNERSDLYKKFAVGIATITGIVLLS